MLFTSGNDGALNRAEGVDLHGSTSEELLTRDGDWECAVTVLMLVDMTAKSHAEVQTNYESESAENLQV